MNFDVRCHRFGRSFLAGLAILNFVSIGLACDNPVFRYALENWDPADYELVRVQVGSLTDAENACWGELERRVTSGPQHPNLRLRSVEKGDLEASLAAQAGEMTATRLLLLSPLDSGPQAIVWQGDCTTDDAERVLQSPARRQIVDRLLGNEAVVWVILARGSSSSSSNAATESDRLTELLADYVAGINARDALEAAQMPAAPVTTRADGQVLDKSVYWPPRFSTLVVDADDPREAVFVAMLRALPGSPEGSEQDVFPIFGRGRALAGGTFADYPEVLRSSCDFLTGACSCQVKEMNPGRDLLLTADWSTVARAAPATQGLFSLLALEPLASPTDADVPTNHDEPALPSPPQGDSPTPEPSQTAAPNAAAPLTSAASDPANDPDLHDLRNITPGEQVVMSRPLVLMVLGIVAMFLVIVVPVWYFGGGAGR